MPVAACEKPESGETNVARADACKANGIAFADCTAHFAGIDAAFEDEWRIERRADIDDIRGPDLRGRDLRNAAANGTLLAGLDLLEARLEGANLSEARLEGANLTRARLEGAYLGRARLDGANLTRARLEGAILDRAQFQSANWASATFGPSPAHATIFAAGRDLTQSQLEFVIGDEQAILPRDAETGEPLHVWSCWESEAAARFIEIWTEHREIAPDDLRQDLIERGWICGPDNPRRPVGTLAAKPSPDGE